MWPLKLFASALVIAIFVAMAIIGIYHRTPLAWIGITGFSLVLMGLAALLIGIPAFAAFAADHEMKIQTEFLSGRAAQWCIAAGLTILLLVTVAITVVFVIERI
jgi:magnesium-transporting ATPase (P-type)